MVIVPPDPPLSPLVAELKREHVAILQALAGLKRVIADPGQRRAALSGARDLLLAHLKKEDDQLYGVLNARARDDAALARTLNVFAADMQEISRFAVGFFAAQGGDRTDADLTRDFGKLIGILGNRIRREEIILYPAYDRAVKS